VIAPARTAAFEVLLAVVSGGSDLPALVAAARTGLRDRRDAALMAEIAYGVERHRAAIDYLIDQVSSRPTARLDAEVLVVLRLSVYQLIHLSRVPAAAVVDDAVELTRRAGKRSASGLTNAVLRSISRRRRSLRLPERPADDSHREQALQYLSVTLSHPLWLAERWLDRLGFEAAEAWMRFNNTSAPLTLRANRLRTTPARLQEELEARGVSTRRGAWAPDALIVTSGDALAGDANRGTFVVQAEASQLVTLLCGPAPGPRVLDTCASPGGKTTALAAESPSAFLVACDVREKRMALLARTVATTGATTVRLVRADLQRPLPFTAGFDCVIVDVPCSGLGTLRRDPDIRWRRSVAELPTFAAAQKAMLMHAAGAVLPGGRLVYATCSSEPDENQDVMEAFLRERPDFFRVPASAAHPQLPAAVVNADGYLETRPDRHGLEMFFGGALQRSPAGSPSAGGATARWGM
jgi:16S rRNA (cytosine967-C5)-methyltransferase